MKTFSLGKIIDFKVKEGHIYGTSEEKCKLPVRYLKIFAQTQTEAFSDRKYTLPLILSGSVFLFVTCMEISKTM